MEKITPVKVDRIETSTGDTFYRIYWRDNPHDYSVIIATDELDAFQSAMSDDMQARTRSWLRRDHPLTTDKKEQTDAK